MENSVKQRLIYYLRYKNISHSEFGRVIGVSNAYVSSIRKSIDIDKIQSISLNFEDINIEWLLTGEGEMLKIKEKPINIPKLIPFYDAQAEAGTVQMSNVDPVTEPVEWIDAGDWFRDADSAMRVHGDSMFPVYESGSIIAMREVFDKRLIVFGQDYMIQTSEYRVIKRLQKSDIQGCWLLCSINEDTWQKGSLLGRLIHEPFDIEVNDVTKIFRVLGCVKRNESSRIVYTNNKRK